MPTDQDYLLLLTGRTVALDLLLRALYAKWASEHSDPENFIAEREPQRAVLHAP